MEELLSYRNELLSAMEADVTRLARIQAQTSTQDWYRPLVDDQRTPHYILARLWVDEAHGFAPLVRLILDEEMPLLPTFDAQAWMADHYDPEVPPGVMIEDFASLRTWEVGLLCGLPPISWSRAARHPTWGVHTLQWWVEQQRENSNRYLNQLIPFVGV